MQEKVYANAIANLEAANVKLFTFKEISEDKDFLHAGENRGTGFSLIEGEVLNFPKLENLRFFWTTFLGRDKKEYKVLKCLVESSMRGWIQFPLGKLCYAPFLQSEKDLLYAEGNLLGMQLAEGQPDYQRAIRCAGSKIEVYGKIVLHQDFWRTNPDTGVREHVEDAEDLPWRKPLVCFRFRKL